MKNIVKSGILFCLLFQACVKLADDLHDPFEAGQWTLYNTLTGLPGNKVSAIATDKAGVMWVAFPGIGVASYENGAWNLFDASNSGLLSNNITCLVPMDNGGMLAGTAAGVAIKPATGEWRPLFGYLAMNSLYVTAIKIASNNDIWIGTNNSELWVVKNDGSVIHLPVKDLVHIYAIEENSKGDIWIGASGGLLMYDAQEQEFYISFAALPITSLFLDSQNRMWAGTDEAAEVVWADASEWFSSLDFMSVMTVRDIFEDSAKNIWFATSGGGLIKYDNVMVHQNMAEYTGFYEDHINAIGEDIDGNLWFGLNTKGLVKYTLPIK